MLNWIKTNPIFAGILLIVLLAVVYGTFRLIGERLDKGDQVLVNSGVQQERGRANEEVINSVQDAKDARDDRSADTERRVCEKYDRNCKDGE